MATLQTPMNAAKPTDDEEILESHCGVGSCLPRALQCFKNVFSFSIFLGLSNMITQALSVYINSQVTALEKQFNMNSTTTGIIMASNDIGFVCSVLFITHFGRYSSKPRVLFLCVMLYGISGIVSSLCYFIDPYQLPKLSEENVRNSSLDQSFTAPLCDAGNTTSDGCGEDGVTSESGSPQWILWLLGLSIALQGIGKSPRLSLSTAYVDDNNPIKTKTGIYLGIISMLTVMGTAGAVVIGGVFRTIPVDLQDTVLTPRHPEWIGAWWIGFLLFGCLGVIVAIPLLFFPKQILPTKETQSPKEDAVVKEKIQELPRSLFRVVRNPVCSLTLIAVLLATYASIGFQSFKPKYVEEQFMVPASKTNIVLGTVTFITITVGPLTGGFLTSRLKAMRISYLKLAIFVTFVALLATVVMFFLGCETPFIHGFHDKEGIIMFDDGVCSCDSTSFFPVCGDNGMTYFSPCFAGCTNQTVSVYGGCSKVTSGQTTAGMCVSDCPYFSYYIAAHMTQVLFQTIGIMAAYVTLVRTVEDKDKAIAFGLFAFMASLLVFLPAPIMCGYIIDSACLIWESSCGVRGACGQYDLESLRYRLIGGDFSFRAASLIFFCLAFIALKIQGGDKPNDETLEMTGKNGQETGLIAL